MKAAMKEEYTTENIFHTLDCIYKEGYSSITALPAWVRNEFRDLTPQQVVANINSWIDSRRIKHPHLKMPEENI